MRKTTTVALLTVLAVLVGFVGFPATAFASDATPSPAAMDPMSVIWIVLQEVAQEGADSLSAVAAQLQTNVNESQEIR